MTKHNRSVAAVGAQVLVPLLALVALAGCDARNGYPEDNVYVPVSAQERYPIEVVKKPVKLQVASKHGHLSEDQADTVARFAQSAQGSAVSTVHVRRPSGGGRGLAVAQDIGGLLVRNGIDESRIVHSTYEGGATAPVLVSYVRHVAVTRECGDWSEDFVDHKKNDPYPNFGCASQHNLAALVSNPRDLEVPRSQQPSDAMRRGMVFDKYRKGDTTVTNVDEQQQQIKVSTVAQQ